MYLKTLEMTGFKSFADKTRLEFEPGMVAIVGPNGCGKSNVSDAIRWVLGEQRPTALRCAKMYDVVFNGTDGRKPLGMAEVSITFVGCEGVLDTDFDEVTITRRVFRSGEGQYFINKQPSRLKDIHRLFMGTGIGTTSYSVMAQGQIDAILSSRPEDRRAIFEEAAGITKFKADRKEALRKIEQTDANLLRLADVIREVKRQIGTLQRQAGKAQKYKELRDELKDFDVFLTRRKVLAVDDRLKELDRSIHELAEQILEAQEQVLHAETASSEIHVKIHAGEELIAALSEQAAQADGKYHRAGEIIRVNEQRMEEYRAWARRDNEEIFQTQAQIDGLKLQEISYTAQRETLSGILEEARGQLAAAQDEFNSHRSGIDEARATVQAARTEAMQCERKAAEIQNRLAELESRQRELVGQRERLTVEHEQLTAGVERARRICEEVSAKLERAKTEAAAAGETLDLLTEEQGELAASLRIVRDKVGTQQSEAAAKRAQIDFLKEQEVSAEALPSGAQRLLDSANPLGLSEGSVAGTLADVLGAPQELRLAVESALRAWLDAVVVRSADDARRITGLLLQQGREGAVRMIAVAGGTAERRTIPGLSLLMDRLTFSPEHEDLVSRLLGHVFLVETHADIPSEIPAGCAVVAKDGAIVHANGCSELWMPDGQISSPLARKMLLNESQKKLEQLEQSTAALLRQIQTEQARSDELTIHIQQARRTLDSLRHQASQAEGEWQSASRELERGSSRLSAVAAQVADLQARTAGDDAEKQDVTHELTDLLGRRNELVDIVQDKQQRLQELEAVYNEVSARLTESRIQVSTLSQQMEHAVSQGESLVARIAELSRTVEGRSRGISSYDESIQKLRTENETLSASLEPLKAEADAVHLRIDAARAARLALNMELERSEAALGEHRRRFDALRDNRSRAEIDQTESRLRRQAQLERMAADYSLNETELFRHPDPAWKDGKELPVPEIEAKVAELNRDIQALGPVNLVAIEEYKEYEERYAFLKAQEVDLIKSREQIMDLIRMINKKTGEMFQNTFDQANANFEKMFTKLFSGGQAKLVLLQNSEDPLECGIDVIARPPGKRPQTISLLSGGERTMTAVSLLFAIFMIKPAPFCLLDELDAALDDSNIGRFVGALKDFLVHSQFLIITHNQYTIAGSDIVYGVTMPEKGVSKIVSMRLQEIGNVSVPKVAGKKKIDEGAELSVAESEGEGE